MDNKYQEALNDMCKNCQSLMSKIKVEHSKDSFEIHECGHQMCPYRTISNDYCMDYDILQQLINNYSTLEKALDIAEKIINGQLSVGFGCSKSIKKQLLKLAQKESEEK